MKIEILSLASNGKGVGYIKEDGFNRSVFIPYAVPRDVVEANITHAKKIYYEADIKKIIEESKERRKPVCPHFMECGACDYLHINYDFQLKEKENQLKHLLKKANLEVKNIILIPSKNEFNYRIRARFQKGEGYYGFYAKKSKDIVKINKCYIIHDKLNEVFKKVPEGFGEESFAYDEESDKIISAKEKITAHYNLFGKSVSFYPGGFVQSNSKTNEELVQIVINETQGDNILELYAGNGNFTIPLSLKAKKIIAVEGSKQSIELMKENITKNNITNVSVVFKDVKSFNPTGNHDTVILDPPRTGSENLDKIESKKIIYISCNPAKMINEIKSLKGYTLSKIYLVDMFAQTIHYEIIGILDKKE